MGVNWGCDRGGCGATLERDGPDAVRRTAPRLLVGSSGGFLGMLAAYLRRLGWEVCTAEGDEEVRELAVRTRPTAVLLSVDAEVESGFLTCAKLRADQPRLRVVLVGPERTAGVERFARFVGAGFVTEGAAMSEVLDLLRA